MGSSRASVTLAGAKILGCPWQPLGNLRPRPADILPGTEVTGGHLKIWSKPGKILKKTVQLKWFS